jgi:hypothetical protein
MARPKKTGMDYFPHDTDAASDEKIEVLRALYGNDGYAFYFIMLERIYRSEGFELQVANVTLSETGESIVTNDEEMVQILCQKLLIETDLFEKILSTCFRREIFSEKKYTEKGVVTSDGIKKRAKPILQKRRKMSKSYKEKAIVSAAETQQKPSRKPAETPPETHIERERKEEHSIEENKEPLPIFGDEPEQKAPEDEFKGPCPAANKNAKLYHPKFEEFWNLYPKRNGSRGSKINAFKQWWATCRDKTLTPDEFIAEITRLRFFYGDHPKDAERWIKGAMWQQEHEPEEGSKPIKFIPGVLEAIKNGEDTRGRFKPKNEP